jgi:hypothetical protein
MSNDDGWIGPDGSSTPLIVALRNALAADGHEGDRVAPGERPERNRYRVDMSKRSLTAPAATSLCCRRASA